MLGLLLMLLRLIIRKLALHSLPRVLNSSLESLDLPRSVSMRKRLCSPALLVAAFPIRSKSDVYLLARLLLFHAHRIRTVQDTLLIKIVSILASQVDAIVDPVL